MRSTFYNSKDGVYKLTEGEFKHIVTKEVLSDTDAAKAMDEGRDLSEIINNQDFGLNLMRSYGIKVKSNSKTIGGLPSFINKKTKSRYMILAFCIDANNSVPEDTINVIYSPEFNDSIDGIYCREVSEFIEKFIPDYDGSWD